MHPFTIYATKPKIIHILHKHKHQAIADHIVNAVEEKINTSPREARLAFLSQVEKWIYSSDCMIAEISYPSVSVGYEIGIALRVGKPVLLLYTQGEPPSLLAYHKDDKLVTTKYTMHNLDTAITEFLHFVLDNHDLRYTFFITSELMAYLDEVSKKDRIPKAVYLRKLIEKDKKHRKYSS